jgi:hypothetical protein
MKKTIVAIITLETDNDELPDLVDAAYISGALLEAQSAFNQCEVSMEIDSLLEMSEDARCLDEVEGYTVMK